MEWVIENWGTVLALAVVVIGAVIGILRIVKPSSRWLQVLIYVLGIIEDLAPETAAKVKGEVKDHMRELSFENRQALQDACAAVDLKKETPDSIQRLMPRVR